MPLWLRVLQWLPWEQRRLAVSLKGKKRHHLHAVKAKDQEERDDRRELALSFFEAVRLGVDAQEEQLVEPKPYLCPYHSQPLRLVLTLPSSSCHQPSPNCRAYLQLLFPQQPQRTAAFFWALVDLHAALVGQGDLADFHDAPEGHL